MHGATGLLLPDRRKPMNFEHRHQQTPAATTTNARDVTPIPPLKCRKIWNRNMRPRKWGGLHALASGRAA
eukprot:6134760-Lingulodinium_polyedra.AAC.1